MIQKCSITNTALYPRTPRMQKVETTYHTIWSSEQKAPRYACNGPCRKVWWSVDIAPPPPPEMVTCPQCKGSLKAAIEGTDYRVISIQPGQTKVGSTNIGSMSTVKPEFVEKAKQEW